jgi:hypothetical protein
MVPSAITVLGSLPLTANGKVDRKHLPMPEIQCSRRETAYVEPTSQIEQKIAAVWREVLASEKVGIHDNFFDLGGNSFLMVQAYTKLRKVLLHDISIIEMFFQYPTIYTLAQFLAEGERAQPALEEISDQGHSRIESHKSSIQQRRWTRLSRRATERNQEDA